MNDTLSEFVGIDNGKTKIRKYIVICLSIFLLGLWSVGFGSLIMDNFASIDAFDIGVFVVLSLFLIFILRFFLLGNKIAWFLLTLIVAFFSGIFIYTIRGFFLQPPESGMYWRFAIFIPVSISILISFALLLLSRTKKDLSISNIFYGICITLCILFLIGGYIIVS